MASPEHPFEDFGTAELKDRRETVKLDRDFAKAIKPAAISSLSLRRRRSYCPSPADKEVFEDILFAVSGGERLFARRAMDEVIGEARLGFHVHDLVARPHPQTKWIDGCQSRPLPMVRVSIRPHLLASMRRIVATRRSNSTGL
jgi:hypothetical protein